MRTTESVAEVIDTSARVPGSASRDVEPRKAVQQADTLVADVDNVTTEDLRAALQKYRSFFDRLLAV